jgi:hypothetical protein
MCTISHYWCFPQNTLTNIHPIRRHYHPYRVWQLPKVRLRRFQHFHRRRLEIRPLPTNRRLHPKKQKSEFGRFWQIMTK